MRISLTTTRLPRQGRWQRPEDRLTNRRTAVQFAPHDHDRLALGAQLGSGGSAYAGGVAVGCGTGADLRGGVPGKCHRRSVVPHGRRKGDNLYVRRPRSPGDRRLYNHRPCWRRPSGEPGVPAMAFRIPGFGNYFPFYARSERKNKRAGLCLAHLWALHLSDSHIGAGDRPSCPAGETLRQISVLAELLEPVAGRNAAAVATRLIDRFGCLARALDASFEQQLSLDPDDADILRQLRASRKVDSIALHDALVPGSKLPTGTDLHSYLRDVLAAHSVEKVHATFLDGARGYLADEIVVVGSTRDTQLRARSLIKRALELGARALILAHNHPSGSPEPSAADIRSTRRLEVLLNSLDIELIDHFVVARWAIVSMREGGYL